MQILYQDQKQVKEILKPACIEMACNSPPQRWSQGTRNQVK